MNRKIYSFGQKKLIQEYYDFSRFRGRNRLDEENVKSLRTLEQLERANRLARTTKLQLRLNAAFSEGGFLCTLTFDDDSLPANIDQAKKARRNFMGRLRYHVKKQGLDLSYIILLELSRNSNRWHIHLVINDIPDIGSFLHKIWQNGQIYIQPLRTDDDYRQLAAYLAKTPRSSSSCTSSRNIMLLTP